MLPVHDLRTPLTQLSGGNSTVEGICSGSIGEMIYQSVQRVGGCYGQQAQGRSRNGAKHKTVY